MKGGQLRRVRILVMIVVVIVAVDIVIYGDVDRDGKPSNRSSGRWHGGDATVVIVVVVVVVIIAVVIVGIVIRLRWLFIGKHFRPERLG